MKKPSRLRESSESEVERLLLRAGRQSAPRGAKRRAMLAATGVLAASTAGAGHAAGAAVAGSTTGAAAGAGTAASTSGAAAGAKVASLVSLKWIVVVGLASVGAVAGTVAVHAARPEPIASRSVAMAVAAPRASGAPPSAGRFASAPVAPAASTSAPAFVASAVPASAPEPGAASPSTSAFRVVAPSAAPAASAGSSAPAELALLDQARGAIDDFNPARALSILEGYTRRFPHGVMGPEAAMLRIEALVNAGDRAAARRSADAFLRANPGSPYAPRIASLLAPTIP